MSCKILALNPGSTSTKVAVYDGAQLVTEFTLRHSLDDLEKFDSIVDQLSFRKEQILRELATRGVDLADTDVIIGRGGLLKPIESGVYEVNDTMLGELREGRHGAHASNLGALLADSLSKVSGARAYIADPVVVDEMDEVAKLTGLAGIRRRSVFHALNQKAVARKYAASVGRRYEDLNLIVAHLGGGISVGAHRRGRVVDVNNALDGDGPFSPERAGRIPAAQLARWLSEGNHTADQIAKKLAGQGGLVALVGTNDVREAIAMAAAGDRTAALAIAAMCYNIGKEIGAMAAALHGEVDAVILTGGIAYNPEVCDKVKTMVGFVAPVVIMPGENELEALAANALAAFEGRLEINRYR